MSWFLLVIVVFIGFAFHYGSSSACPCLTDRNEIFWNGFICSNQAPFRDNNAAYNGDLDLSRSVPLFCPQDFEPCDSSTFCTESWGDWTSLEACNSSCPNNMILWKRSCSKRDILQTGCPLQNETESCRYEACESKSNQTRVINVTNPFSGDRNQKTVNYSTRDPGEEIDDTETVEKTFQQNSTPETSKFLDYGSDHSNVDDYSSVPTTFTTFQTELSTGTSLVDGVTQPKNSITPRDELYPTTEIAEKDLVTFPTEPKIGFTVQATDFNEFSATTEPKPSSFTLLTTISNFGNKEIVGKTSFPASTTTSIESLSVASSSTSTASRTVTRTEKSTPRQEQTDPTNTSGSTTASTTSFDNNITSETQRTSENAPTTGTQAQHSTTSSTTTSNQFRSLPLRSQSPGGKNLLNATNSTDPGNDSDDDNDDEDGQSQASLDLIKIVLGLVGCIGWFCFVVVCVFWMRKRKHQDNNNNNRTRSQRSVTSGSGLYESVGPALPPPRISGVYVCMGRQYQIDSNHPDIETGLYQSANELYIDPATVPRSNTCKKSTENEKNKNMPSELDFDASELPRVSHSEFHQNGYLTPVHLCRDQDTGYISFTFNDLNCEADEEDETLDGQNSQLKEKSEDTISKNMSRSTTNGTDDTTRYEKKRQTSHRFIKRKHRPNLKILLKRASSKEIKKTSESANDISRTPKSIYHSSKTSLSPSYGKATTNESTSEPETSHVIKIDIKNKQSDIDTENWETKNTIKLDNVSIKDTEKDLQQKNATENTDQNKDENKTNLNTLGTNL